MPIERPDQNRNNPSHWWDIPRADDGPWEPLGLDDSERASDNRARRGIIAISAAGVVLASVSGYLAYDKVKDLLGAPVPASYSPTHGQPFETTTPPPAVYSHITGQQVM